MSVDSAIILAGGKGTRLSAVFDGPKALAPIKDKPFILHQLEWLESQGIRHVTMAVGHRATEILDVVNSRHGKIDIRYLYEGEPLGTGGALAKALRFADKFPVFAFNGDTFLDLDLNAMLTAHEKSGASLTIAVCGNVNCGAYLFSANVLLGQATVFSFEDYLEKTKPPTFETEGEMIDIGTPESYSRCCGEASSVE